MGQYKHPVFRIQELYDSLEEPDQEFTRLMQELIGDSPKESQEKFLIQLLNLQCIPYC